MNAAAEGFVNGIVGGAVGYGATKAVAAVVKPLGNVISKSAANWANKAANSKFLGVNSKLFGNNSLLSPSGINTKIAGTWNNYGKMRIGWGVNNAIAPNSIRAEFRISVHGNHYAVFEGPLKIVEKNSPTNFW